MICKCSTVVNCGRNKILFSCLFNLQPLSLAYLMWSWKHSRLTLVKWSTILTFGWAVGRSRSLSMWCRTTPSHLSTSAESMRWNNIRRRLGDWHLNSGLGCTRPLLWNRKTSKVSDQMCIVNYSSLPSVHWELPSGWTLTANCPEYELKPELAPPVGDLGIEYRASAKSAARFKMISLGSLSGSPGCRGINFCNRWNP